MEGKREGQQHELRSGRFPAQNSGIARTLAFLHATQTVLAEWSHPRCRQCNSALGTGTHSPAEGRHWATECPAEGRHGLHWARECRPKAGTGLHWGRPKAGTGLHWGHVGVPCCRPKAGAGWAEGPALRRAQCARGAVSSALCTARGSAVCEPYIYYYIYCYNIQIYVLYCGIYIL